MQITSSDKGVVSMPTIPINEQLLLRLEALFKPIIVTPTTTMNEVMYSAGQMSVLRVLRMNYEKSISQP